MAEGSSLTRRAALASVAVAIILLVLKIWASWETGSVAMLGSLADTGLDLLASLVTLFAVRVASEPADAEHRFGHGKAEAIAALVQTVLIALSALAIGIRAITSFAQPSSVVRPELGIGVSLVAIALTLVLVIYQRSVIARTGSIAISSDNLHYQSDLALNVAVIVAFVIDGLAGIAGADAVFGLLIAAWLGYSAFGTGNRAVDMLMDREWPELRRQQLLNMVAEMPDVHGVHALKTRKSGTHDFAQFKIWLDPKLSVAAAHDIVERVEAAVRQRFPDTEVIVHVDPRGHFDETDLEEKDLWEAESPSAT